LTPATTITQARQKEARRTAWRAWKRSLPDGTIRDFLVEGVIPLLKVHGFAVGFTLDDCVRCTESWAFGHVWKTQHPNQRLIVNFLKSANSGLRDDLDLFQMKIGWFELSDLAELWSCEQFLDDTTAGQSQLYDLQRLLWNLVSVVQSPTFKKWHALMDDDEYEEMTYGASHQEDSGYGGDRRTY
jgi:hypothetical protein